MRWKYLLGLYSKRIEDNLTKINLPFIDKNFPFGRNWIFDLKRILPEIPIYLIDAGANIGEVSKELAYYFPSAHIYSFEPISETYNQLLNNTRPIKNISQQPFALGKTEEEIELYLNPESTINSIKSTYLNSKNAIGKEKNPC